RHERGDAHVIPVLLRPVLFTDTPFAKLQPLPTNRKPVVNWRNRDSAFVDIAVGIERVVQERLASASRVVPTGLPFGDALPQVVLPSPRQAPRVTMSPGSSAVPRVRVLDQSGQLLQVVELKNQGLTIGRLEHRSRNRMDEIDRTSWRWLAQ